MKSWEKFMFYGMLWSIYARVLPAGVESTFACLVAIVCACGTLFTVFSKEGA